MINELNFFNSAEHLEPKCPGCEGKIDYGITTNYTQKHQAHVCNDCGHILK
ncbi:MAG: hypothetical protein QF824_02130 [Candidatus Woesearchaeota archaeon]|jgi:transcription initiation factor TFIIIB Brf1 subunit/transcription initiation factor TFIIB|nr:hypothetical protein [Candidatus Woesearchaeota archaeon]